MDRAARGGSLSPGAPCEGGAGAQGRASVRHPSSPERHDAGLLCFSFYGEYARWDDSLQEGRNVLQELSLCFSKFSSPSSLPAGLPRSSSLPFRGAHPSQGSEAEARRPLLSCFTLWSACKGTLRQVRHLYLTFLNSGFLSINLGTHPPSSRLT